MIDIGSSITQQNHHHHQKSASKKKERVLSQTAPHGHGFRPALMLTMTMATTTRQRYRPNNQNKNRNRNRINNQNKNNPDKEDKKWQSSSTWRHSSLTHGFPQQKRFSEQKSVCDDFVKIDIPEGRSTRACSFGYGKRQAISPIMMRRAKENPSPDKYNITRGQGQGEGQEGTKKGNKFGSGRQSQVARNMQHRKDVYSPHFTINHPSYIYNIREKINAKPIKIGKKLINFTQKMINMNRDVPGPKYLPKDQWLSNQKGLHNASFSSGKKLDLSKPSVQATPGPIYQIKGFTEKQNSLQHRYRF